MGQSTKEIVRRIKSIGNTKKITKAMELVSAAKMRKSVEATLASRFYAKYSWEVLTKLAAVTDPSQHALLAVRPVKKLCVLLITSDKGLCGSYNSLIIKKILQQLKDPKSMMANRVLDKKIEATIDPKDLEVTFICIGKKGAEVVQKLGKKVAAVFTGLSERPKVRELAPVADIIISDYIAGKYDKIVSAYTDYFSVIKQVPKLRQLLPISKIDLEKLISELDTVYDKVKDERFNHVAIDQQAEYVFEPNKKQLLNEILEDLVKMQIYQMVMESRASENSSRMVAMKNASDAAGDMIGELTLIYNKARQASITQEIAEISSGKAALES